MSVNEAVPGLETVVESAAEVPPTVWLPKARLVGLNPMDGIPVPVPNRGTDCGEPAVLSVTRTADESDPATCGENVTLMVQVPAGATDAQLLVCEKEVELPPLIVTLVIVRVPLPGFETVTAVGKELVPTV